jgi:hypothetical protein
MEDNMKDALEAGQYAVAKQRIKAAIESDQFETTPEGVYLPTEKTLVQGVFSVAKRGEAPELSQNLVVNEGLDYILKAAVGETAGIANWYIALFTGDVTVSATWTAATFTATSTEWTNYDESARQVWTKSAVASQGTDSFSNKASFTSSADTQTVRGAALISASAKSATSGVLFAASRLTSDKALDTGEILDVGYGLQLSAV